MLLENPENLAKFGQKLYQCWKVMFDFGEKQWLLCLSPNLMFLMLPLLMLLLHVLLTGSELIAGLLEDVSTAAELVHVIQTLLFLKKSRPQDLIVSQGVVTSMSSIGKRDHNLPLEVYRGKGCPLQLPTPCLSCKEA